jgi:serine/threonine protein kinase
MSASDRWSRVDSLYHAARERDAGERAAFLDVACGDDVELRREVESLLAQSDSSDGLLAELAVALAAPLTRNPDGTTLTGRHFGPYQLQELLGVGGMGEVYRARDERLTRVVAIKVLRHDREVRPDLRHRFRREAQMLARLNHPHICTIYDVGNEDGVDYFVMECLEGESLASRIRSAGRLPVGVAVEYALQIADALNAAHRVGLVHRDLKPTNVFVTKSGTKLLDFGIARSIAPLGRNADEMVSTTTTHTTAEGILLGTPAYMAPEVLEGKPADTRSDMFSYGAVVFEMIAGRPAFQSDSLSGLIAAILGEDPPPALGAVTADLPSILERLVINCLVKNPEARWQSAQDAVLELKWLENDRNRGIQGIRRSAAVQPRLQRLTFNRGTIYSARFVPEGRSVVYSAAWEGTPIQIYLTRRDSPESRPMGFGNADLLAVSTGGSLALSLERQVFGYVRSGVLAQVPFAGTEPRRLLNDVLDADWTPSGERLVVVRRVGTHCQLEWPMGRTVYQTDGLISHLRVSRDGRLVAFLDHPNQADDGGAVVVLDDSMRRQVISDGWVSVWGLAWSPDNREIWFTAGKGGASRELRAAGFGAQERVLFRTTGSLTLHDVAESGEVVLSQDTLHSSVVFRGEDGTIERDLSWLDATYPRDLSPDGAMLLFDETGDGGGPEYGVYIRPTTGAPAVRLGDGMARALSPDQRWVATVQRSVNAGLTLLPTGAGESLNVRTPELTNIGARGATWLSDREMVFSAVDREGALRLFVHQLGSTTARPISSENIIGPSAVSPDRRRVVGLNAEDRTSWVFSVDRAHTPRPISNLLPSEVPVQWSADGTALYLRRRGGEMPLRVYRLDLATGQKSLWREVSIADRAGVPVIGHILLTPDSRNYAIGYGRVLSDLFLVTDIS